MRDWIFRNLPASRVGRTILGILLILGGMLWFLPVVGLWMIPLGFIVLSYDSAIIRRFRRKQEVRIGRWWQARKAKKAMKARAAPGTDDKL